MGQLSGVLCPGISGVLSEESWRTLERNIHYSYFAHIHTSFCGCAKAKAIALIEVFKEDSTGKSVTWLAQNLNYKVEGSYAYGDHENNRKELGLLYTWEAAKNACPSGWHLPTDNEWAMLVNQFGGMDNAGEALKGVKSWNEDGNGSNTSGFDALAGGIRRPDGSYMFQGTLGYFWTSTFTNSVDKVWGWNFHYGGPPSSNKQNLKKAFRWDVQVSVGISVRLVRD